MCWLESFKKGEAREAKREGRGCQSMSWLASLKKEKPRDRRPPINESVGK